MKFNDINGNGLKENEEPGLPNWKIILYGNKTDRYSRCECHYSFANIPAGSYTIVEEQQEGWVQTFPQQLVYFITLSEGQNETNVDFRNHLPVNGSISGMKFNDINGNGLKENERAGLSNWKIILYGNKTDSLFTDANGHYSFCKYTSRKLYHCRRTTEGWVQTFPQQLVYFITLSEGQNETNVDFGNHLPVNGSISGNVWNDVNNNGIKDIGEREFPAGKYFCRNLKQVLSLMKTVIIYFQILMQAHTQFVKCRNTDGYKHFLRK